MQSIPAAVDQNYIENEREFHGFHRGVYMYPCDEVSPSWRGLLVGFWL